MENKIEVIYTGGGITLVEKNLNADRYAVVSSEAPEFMSIYKKTEDDEPYLPEDMIMSLKEADMNQEMKVMYMEMMNKLKNA